MLSILALIVLFTSVRAQQNERFTIEVGQFDKLKVMDNVNVVYRNLPDSTGFVQFAGSREFAAAFLLSPNEGTLKIQVATESLGNPDLPVLYVYSDFLTSVENASEFTVTVERCAPCAVFNAKQIGNGKIIVEDVKSNTVKGMIATGNGSVNISGRCREAFFNMVGTGMISADRLQAESVNCKILGGGSIGCWPADMLVVKGLGSTKIYYKGSPQIKKTGGGKLIPLPGDNDL